MVVLQSWSKREFIADPSTAQHCIDIFEVNLCTNFMFLFTMFDTLDQIEPA